MATSKQIINELIKLSPESSIFKHVYITASVLGEVTMTHSKHGQLNTLSAVLVLKC